MVRLATPLIGGEDQVVMEGIFAFETAREDHAVKVQQQTAVAFVGPNYGTTREARAIKIQRRTAVALQEGMSMCS